MRAALLALAVLALAASAAAQKEDALAPCAPDMQKLCADVAAGHGAKIKCLTDHRDDLSPACKERMDAVKTKVNALVEEFNKACDEDGKKYCAGNTLGSGLLGCLVEHERDLTAPCHAWIAKHQPPSGAAP